MIADTTIQETLSAVEAAHAEVEDLYFRAFAERAQALARLAGERLAEARGMFARVGLEDEAGMEAIGRLDELYTDACTLRREVHDLARAWPKEGRQQTA
jgi:hypothetical protein